MLTWEHKMARNFGSIPGVPVGSTFPDRHALRAAGVHMPLQAGISGGARDGVDSIVLSGGYEDDQDLGDVIIYTGHGGNVPKDGRQFDHQDLVRGNQGLVVSQERGLPIRVTRGARLKSEFAPKTGYRYDGLYRVTRHWQAYGQSGFRIWRFRLEQIAESE